MATIWDLYFLAYPGEPSPRGGTAGDGGYLGTVEAHLMRTPGWRNQPGPDTLIRGWGRNDPSARSHTRRAETPS
jgi:hypothetical protein